MASSSPKKSPLLRAAAVTLSVSLAAFVIINAQAGCDAADSEMPDAETPKEAPAADAEAPAPAEPVPPAQPGGEPAGPDTSGGDPARAANAPAALVEPPTPMLMPASKSGGDFAAVPFPGNDESKPAPQQATQQAPRAANPAPNRQGAQP